MLNLASPLGSQDSTNASLASLDFRLLLQEGPEGARRLVHPALQQNRPGQQGAARAGRAPQHAPPAHRVVSNSGEGRLDHTVVDGDLDEQDIYSISFIYIYIYVCRRCYLRHRAERMECQIWNKSRLRRPGWHCWKRS